MNLEDCLEKTLEFIIRGNLSFNEVRIYLFLFLKAKREGKSQTGFLAKSDLVRASNISFSNIDKVLDSLLSKGAIRVNDVRGRFSIYEVLIPTSNGNSLTWCSVEDTKISDFLDMTLVVSEALNKALMREKDLIDSSRAAHVYFVQSKDGGPIKIGRSANLEVRLQSLQRSHSNKLTILNTITCIDKKEAIKIEGDLHKKFYKYRSHGEWYEPCQELIELIERI